MLVNWGQEPIVAVVGADEIIMNGGSYMSKMHLTRPEFKKKNTFW
jgi:hypothetical protein